VSLRLDIMVYSRIGGRGMPQSSRLTYLAYRCEKCGRLLTKLEMIEGWERAERDGISLKGVCSCGSGRVSPTNPKLWEEICLPRVWRLWWKEVALPWVRSFRR